VSFWDEYEEIGGNFIGADEKRVLMDAGIPMTVQSIVEDQHNQYGPRYVAKVVVPNPETGEDEERAISFPIGTVESRDRMLSQMIEYLGREDAEQVAVKLEQVGRSILVRQA
jgi:hypothetical protein